MASGCCGVKGTQSRGRVADDQDKKCFLCGRVDRYMTRFTNWKSNEKEFVLQHVVNTPSDSSYMCNKCKLKPNVIMTHTIMFQNGRGIEQLLPNTLGNVHIHNVWLQRNWFMLRLRRLRT